MKRKIISLILAIATVISLIPTNIFVFSTDDAASAEYGDVLASFKDATAVVYADTTYEAEVIGVNGTAFGDNGTFRLVEYYATPDTKEVTEEELADQDRSVRRYRIHSDDLPEDYLYEEAWVNAADLTNIRQDDILEDTTLVGKQIRVIGHYDNYDDTFAASFHLNPIGELHIDGASYWTEWTTEDEAVIFTIEDVYKTPWGEWYYVTTENENYADVNEMWIDVADTVFVEEDEEILIEGQVGITQGGEELTEITIARGQKEYVFTELDENLGKAVSYQWQILIDAENDRWANIYDGIYSYAVVSEALVCNILDDFGQATIRCIVTKGGLKYVSGELVVTLSDYEKTIEDEEDVPVLDTVALDEAVTGSAFQITIEYKYLHETNTKLNNQTVAGTFSITLQPGNAYSGTVVYPPKVGYKTYVAGTEGEHDKVYGKDTYNGMYLKEETEYKFNAQNELFKRVVYYVPQEVNYTIKYFHQDLISDNYNYAGEDVVWGIADSFVGEVQEKAFEGFKALAYDDKALISANGTSVLEIYYDREYYLVDFDLSADDGSKGYGTMPYYVRYGTQINVTTPENPGYSFTGWTLQTMNDKAESALTAKEKERWDIYKLLSATNSQIVVKDKLLYKAKWTVSKTAYTVVYWWQDADPRVQEDGTKIYEYSVWKTSTIKNIPTGTVITQANVANYEAAANFDDVVYGVSEKNYFTYNATKTLNDFNNVDGNGNADYSATQSGVVVKGDGTTAINIYYDRNDYTLRFYYAMSSGSNKNIKYYIIGGSTYGFGSWAQNNADNDVKLIDQYMTYGNISGLEPLKQRGESESLPKLKKDFDETKYGLDYETGVLPSETSKVNGTEYKYYYLEFEAKYGGDISALWPCDIFDSVTTLTPDINTTDQAYASAWNGEHHVYYSQHNANQTIKGKYQVLDYNLLWDFNKFKALSDSTNTVSYLCFWENGADVNWSFPELYRYKIWLPCLAGVTYPETKTYNNITIDAKVTYNNKEYYLSDVYDTCDDSDPKNQTQPALTGFQPFGGADNDDRWRYYGNNSWSSRTNFDYYPRLFSDIGITNAEINEIKGMQNYQEAYVMNFFYERKTSNLSYSDNAGSPDEPLDIPYGTNLNVDTYTKPDGPAYPSSFETNEKVFVGWYLNEQGTMPFHFFTTDSDGNVVNTTMPAKNFKLYAKWEPTYWNVNVYLEKPTADAPNPTQIASFTKEGGNPIEFGSQISDSDMSEARNNAVDSDNNGTPDGVYESKIFNGWYYMENGVEKRFRFDTMTIKHDYEIYAKWTSDVLVPYTIYYKTTIGGQLVDVAKPEKGMALAGLTRTFEAKAGDKLYDEDDVSNTAKTNFQTGYFPKVRTDTLMMELDKTKNVLTFYYEAKDEIKYTVKHVFKSSEFETYLGTDTLTYTYTGRSTSQKNSALIMVLFKTNITFKNIDDILKSTGKTFSNDEKAKLWTIISKLSPNAYQQEFILTTEEQNVVEFNWEVRTNSILYEIIIKHENITDDQYTTYLIYQDSGTASMEISYDIPKYVGFEFKKADYINVDKLSSDSSSTVKFELPASQSIDKAIQIVFYYIRDRYTYTVKYQADGNDIATSKEYKNVKHGTTVKEYAPALEDYYVVGATSYDFEIQKDTELVFTYLPLYIQFFYYAVPSEGGKADPITLYIKAAEYTKEGVRSTAQPYSGYIFSGWYTDENCLNPVDGTTATAVGATITPEKPTFAQGETEFTVYYYAKFIPTSLTLDNSDDSTYHDDEQGFIYRIKGSDSATTKVDMRVTVIAGGEVTITHLPIGQYSITVENDWSWRYGDFTTSNFNQDGNFDFSGTGTVTFNYSSPNSQWLSDNDYAEN